LKTALITLIDDNFLIGYEVFYKSLHKHNPDLKIPFIVLDAGLSSKSKAVIKKNGGDVRPIETSAYDDIPMGLTHQRLKKTYYTLDVFKQNDFDRLLFFDMDIVIMDNISELIDWEMSEGCHIAACRAYNANRDALDPRINSGVWIADKQILTEKTFTRLMGRAMRRPRTMPDQTIINEEFAGRIDFLPKRYNIEKRMQYTKKYKHVMEKPAAIHYVSAKPWDKKKPKKEQIFEEIEKHWWDVYNE